MMRVLFFLLLSLTGSFGVFAQQSIQLQFDQANTFLEDGDFIEALQAYRQIELTEQVSGGLFLNMGIAATQLDSMGLAKFYFLKSSRFSTTHEESSKALEYISSQFSRQSATLPKLPWDKAVDFMKDEIGAFVVFLIGFLLLLTSAIFLLAKWFNFLSFKKLIPTIITFVTTGIFVILLSFYVDYVDLRFSEAVIIVKETSVKQNPDDSSDLVSLAYEGYSIIIDHRKSKNNPGWCYIRLGNGQFGWIEASGTKIL